MTSDDTPAPDPLAPPVEAAPDAADSAASEDQRVPLDRFRSVTSENKELRAQLDELATWKAEQETAAMTELERERTAREKAEADAATASARVESLERGAWIRNAATAAGFTDPEDAVALLGTGTVEDAEAAAKHVADLADKKPHLIAGANAQPTPISAPLSGGGTPTADNADPKTGLAVDLLNHIRGQ